MAVFDNISVTNVQEWLFHYSFWNFLSLVIMNNIWWQYEHTVCSERWHFRRRSSAQFDRVLLTRLHTFGHITVKKWKPHHIPGHMTVCLIMALAVKVAFWDTMLCNQVHMYWHFGGMCSFHLHGALFKPEDVNLHCISILPCIHVCIARFNPWPRYSCYVYMYEANSKSKVPYFIPAEMITASSWQAWVLVVHMFTTI